MDTIRPEEVGLSATRLDRIAPAMQVYVDQGLPPGLITAVARRGKLVHFDCYGMRDVQAGKPMRLDTLLRIYSMTKPITAVALLMLLEGGRFLLDDPVSKYIPRFQDLKVYTGSTEAGVELADVEREITIRHLLTHTAGLSYGLFPDSPVEDLYREAGLLSSLVVLQVPLPELVRRLAELPLAHQPGTVWRYSLAYDVIGYLIGVLADLPFDVYLQEKILGPLGMADTGFYVPQDKLDRLAGLYGSWEDPSAVADAPTVASPFADPTAHPSGGAGLVSTAADYMRFAQMLLNGGELDGTRLLGRKTVARMAMNHLPAGVLLPQMFRNNEVGAGYGLGVAVCIDAAQRPTLASTGMYGWSGAAGTQFWVDPREERVGLYLPQFFGVSGVKHLFQNLVYQVLVD